MCLFFVSCLKLGRLIVILPELFAGFDEDYVILYLFPLCFASSFSSYIHLVPEAGGFLLDLGSVSVSESSYPLKSHDKMKFQCGTFCMLSNADGVSYPRAQHGVSRVHL